MAQRVPVELREEEAGEAVRALVLVLLLALACGRCSGSRMENSMMRAVVGVLVLAMAAILAVAMAEATAGGSWTGH